MIYFIGNKKQRFVKIGYTVKSVVQRFHSLQCASPFELEIMASIEGVLNTEAHIHELFKHLHIRGEWYVYCQEIQDFMDNPQLPSFEETFTHLSYITENHKTKIEQLYQDGVSLNKIAKQTGFSSHQIRRYKEKYNLPLKYPAAPRSKNTGQAKHTKTPKTILVPKEVKIALI